MIELNQLHQFITIAEVGTLSKAAEVLLISQPALTRSMQRLEEDLGIQLFERKKNKLALNENGVLAKEHAQRILNETKQMIQSLQDFDKHQQVIMIGSCAPAPIWALTTIFKQLYSLMQVNSELVAQKEKLMEGLINHHYSMIVLNQPIDDEKYECIELFEEHLYLSVPPAHSLATATQISFQDLDGESVLLLSKIGFWNEICLKMIPNSHLLIQEDNLIFNELAKASALPNFISNVNLLRGSGKSNRVSVPIIDKEASAKYYAVYPRNKHAFFQEVYGLLETLDWKTTSDVE